MGNLLIGLYKLMDACCCCLPLKYSHHALLTWMGIYGLGLIALSVYEGLSHQLDWFIISYLALNGVCFLVEVFHIIAFFM